MCMICEKRNNSPVCCINCTENRDKEELMTKRRHRGKAVIIGAVLLITALIWGIVRLNTLNDGRPDGSTAEKRIEYIQSFGWEVGIAPSMIKEIRIPANFDEAYEQYNALQKEQGFDLRQYRACYAYKYTYDITNFAEPSSESGGMPVPICANLIVYDGRIIGADISSSEANGLVTVLAKK